MLQIERTERLPLYDIVCGVALWLGIEHWVEEFLCIVRAIAAV